VTAIDESRVDAERVSIAKLTRSWKVPIVLGIFAILAIFFFVVLGRDGSVTFTFTASHADSTKLPQIVLPVRATGIVVSIIAVLMAIGSALWVRQYRKTPLWYIALFSIILLIGFLTWATAGNTLPITGLLAGSLALSVPIIFGALGGVISERVGVVDVAIEGQMLAGAFVSAMVASITRSLFAGLLAAMVAGVLVSFVLAAFSIKYLVDQVIVGVVLNVFVLGLTSFFYSTVMTSNAALLNSPPQFNPISIPLLSSIPVIGPVLFQQTIIVYIMYFAVALVFFGLFYTRWGLRLRAVGEHPQAADTVGINVTGTRFWNVSLAGAVAGLGGAYFTLGSVGAFSKDITSGEGFIALAAVIFGRWNPIRATLAALLFGFATNLQYVLGQLQSPSPVPSDFLLMLPYLVTIIAVAGLVGQSRGPAASGKPYIKS
jgi:general nucleoside transport system permease protein